jgi:hypothetical protein
MTCCFRKTKSGLPGNGWCRRQPLIPRSRKMAANFSSVSLLPFDRIAAMTCERFFFEKTSAIASGAHATKDRNFFKVQSLGFEDQAWHGEGSLRWKFFSVNLCSLI